MGRSKLNSALQSGTSIPFPHDGPIFYCSDDTTDSDKSLQAARRLLNSANISTTTSEDCSSLAARLCQTLQNASNGKEQLHALGSYRSTILNLKRKNEMDALPDDGLYRLLLEWSLSYQSPVPLQRSIHSVLDCIETASGKEDISMRVIESLWKNQQDWANPLFSLDVAAHDAKLAQHLQGPLFSDCMSFLFESQISKYLDENTTNQPHESPSFTKDSVILSKVLKILLNNNHADQTKVPFLNEFEKYILLLLESSKIPTDTYNTLGIIYGSLLLSKSPSVEDVIGVVESLDHTHSNLSSLARLSMLQGVAATLDSTTLLTACGSGAFPLESCWKYSLQMSKVATDPMVRWGALKGLSTLAARWSQCRPTSGEATLSSPIDALTHETLEVVLQAWENPPLRKLAKAIPGLFETLVKLMTLDQTRLLCENVLNQPANRKGKYLALNILLKQMPPAEIIDIISLDSLLEGIGDRGSNTTAIADLWINILQTTWTTATVSTQTDSTLQDKKNDSQEEVHFDEWTTGWAPSLARALVAQELSRRKQIAAFCIGRIVDLMKRVKNLRVFLDKAFITLFDEIHNIQKRAKGQMNFVTAGTKASLGDRVLWAHLELARHTTLNKISSHAIQQAITAHLPADTLRVALTHSSASVRLAAFQSLEALTASYSLSIEFETDLWRYAFPYAAKTTDNTDYTTSLLQYLSSFMDRLSSWEAGIVGQSSTDSKGDDGSRILLPRFYSFVSEFLLGEVIQAKGAYPGTIADKEGFVLLLLESLLAFVTQDQSYTDEQSVGRNAVFFKRKREPVEVKTMNVVLDDLLGCETFAALVGLLHSIWDGTRETAFRFLSKLVVAAQAHEKPLPVEFSSDKARAGWHARAVYLASSPRQREADTGARMLAFLYASAGSENSRRDFQGALVDLLETRLSSMKSGLESILRPHQSDSSDRMCQDGSTLPLAHGLIHATRLSIEHRNALRKRHDLAASTSHQDLYEHMIDVFCQAIQVSLAVVADVRDGEVPEGMEDDGLINTATPSSGINTGSSTPLNVNTGAIGANGAFSKLTHVDEDETKGRIALQRVVIGSWLLTKEACAAVASAITSRDFEVPAALVEKVGKLLITTLTSVKHAGAAFAARDSLQSIAKCCLSTKQNSMVHSVPAKWADRLMDEISANEQVRDSTLRRSTGYALGFVALMRSEIMSKVSPPSICTRVLQTIIVFALPVGSEFADSFAKLGLCDRGSVEASEFFYTFSGPKSREFVSEEHYEARCRIHALNVLRLIILDAPLSSAVGPFVGDAILAALLGYNDTTWAVRNSATMVFSAAMLRVVDADKNASNTDTTSGNAITITELFRRYPSVANVMLAVMQKDLITTSVADAPNSQSFPILLLLSRVQPLSNAREVSSELIERFPPIVFKCLSSRHHSVRAAASRALANLSVEDQDSSLSSYSLLSQCKDLLENAFTSICDWNMIDGVLLTVSALVSSFESARTAFRGLDMSTTLLDILKPDQQGHIAPPSSMSTALETLIIIVTEGGLNAIETQLPDMTRQLTQNHQVESLIGGATLLSTASIASCRLLQPHLWNPTGEEQFKVAVDEMERLLSNKSIDVRLAAVKYFKKGIYKNIDTLVDATDTERRSSVPSHEEILSAVAKMLLRCLSLETCREGDDDAHIPTERRLSRCFLECFHGYCAAVGSNTRALSTFLKEKDFGILRSTCSKIIEHEDLSKCGEREVNGETFLSSNAAEILAIVVARRLKDNRESLESATSECLDGFVELVETINDPDASWRSRYGAAVSIETSQVLKPGLPKVPAKYRQKLLFQVLDMLQDSDPDVRASAGRTAGTLLQTKQSSYTVLPEIMLDMTYRHVFASGEAFFRDTASAQALIQGLLTSSAGILDRLRSLEEEFRETSDISVSASDLINATTSRKIFEEGDYNPYQEQALQNQLVCRALIEMEQGQIASIPIHGEILSLCNNVLHILLKNIGREGMAHDMTRFPTIFASLHGLLLGSTVVLFLGATDAYDVRATAAQLVKSSERAFFHPNILLPLQCVSQAKAGDPSTKESVSNNSFLLKGILD